jgi:membrane-associated protein
MAEVFQTFTVYAQTHIELAPYCIFGLLLLAGFNVPVSEDAMLFLSAILAKQNPHLVYHFFIAVYAGAYISDLICYALGRFLGPKLKNIKWFSSMINDQQIAKMNNYYNRYGIWTLVLGRFIPFGVRNLLFLTAGMAKMNAIKFSLSDLVAATISCSLFFYLYFTYGEAVIELVKKGNYVIFAIALIGVIFFLVNRKRKSYRGKTS